MKYLKINSLDKGWCDKDYLLLYAAFQILVDFIEKEHVKTIDWNSDRNHKKAWAEMQSLYNWWRKIRPERKSPLDNKKLKKFTLKYRNVKNRPVREIIWPDKKKYAENYKAMKRTAELDMKWYKEDTENLHRLVKIRDYLWI